MIFDKVKVYCVPACANIRKFRLDGLILGKKKELPHVEAPSFYFDQLTAGSQMPQVLWVLQALPERKPPGLMLIPLIFEEKVEINLRTRSLLQYGQVT